MTSSRGRHHVEHRSAQQHGVILRDEALAAGLNPRQIKRRLQRGQWVRGPAQGVYLLPSFAEDSCAQLIAACRALNGMPWAQSAVAVWDLMPHPIRPVVAVRDRRSCASVDIVRPRRLDHVFLTRRHWGDVPTVESAIASISATTSAARVHTLLEEALRRQLTTSERIAEALARFCSQGRPGSTVLNEVLQRRMADHAVPLSDWGRWFVDKLEESGLARPRLEYRVLDRRGALLAQVDAAFVEALVAFELDSVAHHHDLVAFERDRMRDLQLAAAGWRTIRVTWHQFNHRWDDIVDAARSALSERTP